MISVGGKRQAYLLQFVVFTSGAVVMILELTGSRILAPYIGTSLPVWTSIIGIILGSLSIGYMLGGRLADKKPTYMMFGIILFFSALSLGFIPVLTNLLLRPITVPLANIQINAIISSAILFALPSILLGMVSPYAIRLKLEKIENSGRTAGGLYAISTTGSIAGTFFAGFYLIGVMGSTYIMYLISGAMFLLSIFVWTGYWKRNTLSFLLFFGLSLTITYLYQTYIHKNIIEINTQYNTVRISDTVESQTNKPIREMLLGEEHMSGMYRDSEDLLYHYTKFYRLGDYFKPDIKSALMIGGAGYSYPKDFISKHPTAHMDVIEIDQDLTKLAERYFRFRPTNQISIYHEDARTFLNREEKKYDAIFNDAFTTNYSPPFHLTTKETVGHIYNSLGDDGVLITNVISAITGEKGKFLRAQYHTYKSVFPYVAVFPVNYPSRGDVIQNIMIVAAKKQGNYFTDNPEYLSYLSQEWKENIAQDVGVLTDDFAPVELYALKRM